MITSSVKFIDWQISHDTTSHDVMSHNATSHDAMSHNAMSHNAMSHDATSYNATSYNATCHNATFHDTTSHNVTSHSDSSCNNLRVKKFELIKSRKTISKLQPTVNSLLAVTTQDDFLKSNYVEILNENDLVKILRLNKFLKIPLNIIFFDSNNLEQINFIEKYFKKLRIYGHLLFSININIYEDINYKYAEYSKIYLKSNEPCYLCIDGSEYIFGKITKEYINNATHLNFNNIKFDGSSTLLKIIINEFNDENNKINKSN